MRGGRPRPAAKEDRDGGARGPPRDAGGHRGWARNWGHGGAMIGTGGQVGARDEGDRGLPGRAHRGTLWTGGQCVSRGGVELCRDGRPWTRPERPDGGQPCWPRYGGSRGIPGRLARGDPSEGGQGGAPRRWCHAGDHATVCSAPRGIRGQVPQGSQGREARWEPVRGATRCSRDGREPGASPGRGERGAREGEQGGAEGVGARVSSGL